MIIEGYEISLNGAIEQKVKCPKCRQMGKKNINDTCLAVNTEKTTFLCHKCGWKGFYGSKMEDVRPTIQSYQKPNAIKKTTLDSSEKLKKMRGIDQEVTKRNKIKVVRKYNPQTFNDENALVFEFWRNDELINRKYRFHNKVMTQEKGCEQIWYKYDDIDNACTIICEGEFDALSIETAGFKNVVSVPAGAPNVGSKLEKKFQFLDSSMERLKTVKQFILFCDDDPNGRYLSDELVRRLGAKRCKIVEHAPECKDANDVLVKLGPEYLKAMIDTAKFVRVEGIFSGDDISDSVFDLYDNGNQLQKYNVAWPRLREFYSVVLGEWTLITGIPGHGKSEFLDDLLVNLSIDHGLKFSICSPENQPLRNHAKKLCQKIVNKPFFGYGQMSRLELSDSMQFVNKHFSFVALEKLTIDLVLNRFDLLIEQKGVNGFVIDPWNEIEHRLGKGQSETLYISETLSKIRSFARKRNVHPFIVAHPTKLQKDNAGEYQAPTPYDISGGANWRNKGDNILCVHRPDFSKDAPVEIHVQKIRFQPDTGRTGKTELMYNILTGKYYEMEKIQLEEFEKKVKINTNENGRFMNKTAPNSKPSTRGK